MCVEYLMMCGANSDVLNSSGKTPEDVAIENAHVPCMTCIQEIKSQRIKKKVKANRLKQALLKAESERGFRKLFYKMVDDDVKTMAMEDGQVLIRACEIGCAKEVELLVTKGITAIPESEGLDSSLHVACKTPDTDDQKQVAIVQILLEHFPGLLHISGLQGNRPLHYAASAGNSEVVRFLLECYKAVWFCFNDFDHRLALPKAIKTIAAKYCFGVSEPDLDINEQREDMKTALHLACSAKHVTVVKVMSEFSVQMSRMLAPEISDDLRSHICNYLMIDFSLSDINEETVLLQATASNNDAIIDLLFDNAPNMTDCGCLSCNLPSNNSSCDLLTTAVQSGHLATVKVLLKHSQCIDMSTALNEAFAQKREDIIALLLLKSTEKNCTTEDVDPNEINWQGLSLPYIDQKWIIQAADRLALMNQASGLVNSIPSSMSQVTYIDLSQNQLTSLPIEVFLMTELTTLSLANNQLTVLFDSKRIPVNTDSLETITTDAQTISAGANISTLPCQKLKTLNVSKNRLTALPPELFELPELQTLAASGNCIKQLPDNFWLSSSLKEVLLVKNEITHLPGPHGDYAVGAVAQEVPLTFKDTPKLKRKSSINLWRLGSLTSQSSSSSLELDEDRPVRCVKSDCLRNRSVESSSEQSGYPTSISSLEECVELDEEVLPHDVFSPSKTVSFEDTRGQLQPILKMSAHALAVKSLASSYSMTSKESPAMIIGDSMQSFPDGKNASSHPPHSGVYTFTVSESVDDFDALHKGVHGQGSSLTELNLSRNKLKSLPLGFPCLVPNLKKLNISSNKFEELDPVAMLPQSVEYLNANSNSIKTMTCKRRATKECCAKTKGKKSGTEPCQHQCHDTLPNLSYLRLKDNRLVHVELIQAKRQTVGDVDTGGQVVLYPSLISLELSNNKLNAFPLDIACLKELSTLDVSRNKDIKMLPLDLIQLPNLMHLPLDELDLNDFPQTEMNRGARRVQNFLKHRQEGKKPYRRMKLMVVGLAKKGKSTLVHRLADHGSFKWRRLFSDTKLHLKAKTRQATVGIDITEMVLQPSKGEGITFGVWDFAGQEEYYATHQCFLTQRSIYLVIWSLKDGIKGIENLASWLCNIEACAPGSPVLIVGTHLDEVDSGGKYFKEMIDELERRYMSHCLPCFPRVVDHIEVALENGLRNVGKLQKEIVKVACEMCYPRGMRFHQNERSYHKPLLQQNFPSSYLWLEETVTKLKDNWDNHNRPPVIDTQEFLQLLKEKVSTGEGGIGAKRLTENKEELEHATRFLHDNGVLMNYYKEPLLKNLYFIDPKWLCRMAAKVVGLKESSPFIRNGVLHISDLQQLYQGNEFPHHLHSVYIALLEKFEVALRIGGEKLLIPSVLPETANEAVCLSCESLDVSCTVEYSSVSESPFEAASESSGEVESPLQPSAMSQDHHVTTTSRLVSEVGDTRASYNSKKSHKRIIVKLPRKLYRIYLIPFHPSGFWPRLVSRILTDKSIQRTIKQLIKVEDNAIQWSCWRRGLYLKVYGIAVLSMEGYPVASLCHRWQEKHPEREETTASTLSFEIDGQMTNIESFGGCCLEISVAPSALVSVLRRRQHAAGPSYLLSSDQSGKVRNSPPAVKRRVSYDVGIHTAIHSRPTRLGLQRQTTCRRMTSVHQQRAHREADARNRCLSQMAAFLLSKGAYHIDGLLEDWYEGLQPSGSVEDYSPVKRIIPCLFCIADVNSKEPVFDPDDQQTVFTHSDEFMCKPSRAPIKLQRQVAINSGARPLVKKKSFVSTTDDWVNIELPRSSSDHLSIHEISINAISKSQTPNTVRYISLSSCITHVYKNQIPSGESQRISLCSQHKEVTVSLLAPDVVFQDLSNSLHVQKSRVNPGNRLGGGAYGSVFQGYKAGDPENYDIAIKTFDQVLKLNQPANITQEACLLYYTARSEVSIMMSLDHPNILPLCGLCVNPLWLLTQRAPGGDLSSPLKEYRKCNAQILPLTLREVLIQIASGMEHIHTQNIIYRDLRVDNVLVWSFPSPGCDEPHKVSVKIADYGISRFVSSFGIKPGKLEGNPNYLAPEIVQYNGKEAYSTKADVFNYGLLIYELLTLQKPYEGIDHGVSARYLKGERPKVPIRCRRNFFSFHTLKQWCWTQDPSLRPHFSQVLEFIKAENFLRLVHHARLTKKLSITTGCAVSRDKTRDGNNPSECYLEVWVSSAEGHISIVQCQDKEAAVSVVLDRSSRVHTMCAIRDTVWVGTEHGLLVFSVSRRRLLHRWPNVGNESGPILTMFHDEVRKCVLVSGHDKTLSVFEDGVGCEPDAMSSFAPWPRLITQHNMENFGLTLIHCMTIVNQNDLWIGLDRGRIAVLDAPSLLSHGNQIVIKKKLSTCNHLKETGLGDFVKCLVTGQCTDDHCDYDGDYDDNDSNHVEKVTDKNKKYVWSGLHRRQVVYQWDATTQQEAGHVDCYSFLKKKGVSDRDSRVTSMLVHAGHLFIGTGGGHVVIIAIPNMQILTTIIPHSGAIRCLIPFKPVSSQQTSFLLSSEQSIKPNKMLNDLEYSSPGCMTAVPNCALGQFKRAAVVSCGLGLYGLTKQDSAHYPSDILPVDEDEGHMLMWLADNWSTPDLS
jgi:Leucine-rich repeat (LRR) protein/GTPase SAR1 family protein